MARPTKLLHLYQVEIVLKEIEPRVWRRLLIPGDSTLDKLHYVIQDAFSWTNSHLHCFVIDDVRYGMAHIEEDADDLKDEQRFFLHKLVDKGSMFLYEYDYGDSWSHKIAVENLIAGAELKHPICLDGQRACPPEDVGGTGGYEEFLDALADPKHEEHKNMLRWAGGRFDPEHFDLANTNAALRSSRTERLTRRAMRRA
jgi:hypothetical protein